MNWKELLNVNRIRKSQVDDKRKELSNNTDNRNPFESDFGRVIFSSASRRLHDKTQVFPLTTNDNIHSRLTHSLEVMNIGLSFSIYLCDNEEFKQKTGLDEIQILREISPILKTACLVHDIGNPPFGHFGEEIIQDYFKNLIDELKKIIENKNGKTSELSMHIYHGVEKTEYAGPNEKIDEKIQERRKCFQINALTDFLRNQYLQNDYIQFDGNAEGFRVLTKLQYLGDLNGLNLTYATLSATLKYPNYKCADKRNANIGKHKHGVFFTEREILNQIAKECGTGSKDGSFFRHPLSYLMEAASSICYLIMDIEDANQKQWITLKEIKDYIQNAPLISEETKKALLKNTTITSGKNNYYKKEWVSFRTTLLSHLMGVATHNFVTNLENILNGTYNEELIEDGDGVAKSLNKLSRDIILSNREIISLEITGEAVISGILDAYIKYFFHTNKAFRNRGKALISRSIFMTVLHEHQEKYKDDEDFKMKYGEYQDSIEELYKEFDVADFTVEERFRLIRDFIAGMTDKFALNHIQKLNGQKI